MVSEKMKNAIAIMSLVILSSCASTQLVQDNNDANNVNTKVTFGVLSQVDPFENFNRKVASFNDSLDNFALKPVAQAYKKNVPDLVRTGVSNFFFNLSSVWTVVNNVLQGHGQAAAEGVIRVGVNTIFGFVGVFDIASEMNIERHKADFGQTLGRWGVPPGPYLVIPILGPSTLRDTLASTVISKGDLVWQLEDMKLRNSLYVFRAIDQRANLLNATNMLEDSALDKYTFSRDIFLQLRMNEVEQASGHTTSSDEYLDDLPVQTPLNEMSVPSPVANAARPSQNQNQNAGVADANTTSINNEAINLDSTSKINVVINTQLADSDTEQKQQGVQLPQISASQVQASSN
jgi:phospholipid-binding lipoprotein MlaA